MLDPPILLNAYWERLYARIAEHRDPLSRRAGHLLSDEAGSRGFPGLTVDRLAALTEVAQAFLDERIEMYNPLGIQFRMDGRGLRDAAELEMRLAWYDGRGEYARLRNAVIEKAGSPLAGKRLQELADELIADLGAYPDRSIIRDFRKAPSAEKLPDYAVSVAIEEFLH